MGWLDLQVLIQKVGLEGIHIKYADTVYTLVFF